MKFSRKINPEYKTFTNFLSKKRIREDEINFEKLRSYRLDRVKKELIKNNLEACILFDPVNVRYALDTVNMSVFNMHNLLDIVLFQWMDQQYSMNILIVKNYPSI